jgi:hypothetical protein
VLRQAGLPWRPIRTPRAVAASLPRATDPPASASPLPTRLLTILLRGGVPLSSLSTSPELLGLVPSLGGVFNEDSTSRLACGPTPPAAGGVSCGDHRFLHPCGSPVVAIESSSGAAHPLGGPTVDLPRSATRALRAETSVMSSSTSPLPATAATCSKVGAVSAAVEQEPGGPPGPSRAVER